MMLDPQTPSAKAPLDLRRVALYLAFAYGIAWTFGLIIALTGGIAHSPSLIPGTPITLALVLLASGYMGAPALAHILTRLISREGWRDTKLRPQLKHGWPYWLAAWFLPALLTILGAALFFALFPRFFDPALSNLQNALAQATRTTGQPIPFGAWALIAIQTGVAVVIAPLLNGLFTFGEEFGWRGYLLPKLLPLGERRALLISGLIWGIWHWPVIAMGHNYGLSYPGAPWTGMLAMTWFTVVTGVFLGWAALRGGSVWPAVIGHAAINGISGLGALFVRGEPNPLLGPLAVGLIGSAAWAVLALWILLHRNAPIVARPTAQPLQRST
jgi:membrane protease YdiL (CAAX protease family)